MEKLTSPSRFVTRPSEDAQKADEVEESTGGLDATREDDEINSGTTSNNDDTGPVNASANANVGEDIITPATMTELLVGECLSEYSQPQAIDMNNTDGNEFVSTLVSAVEYEITHGDGAITQSDYFKNLDKGETYKFEDIEFEHKGGTIKISSFSYKDGEFGGNFSQINGYLNSALQCRDATYGAYRNNSAYAPRFSNYEYGFRFPVK